MLAAQAQKEVFVNEAHVLTDALLHPVAEGIATVPPGSALNGECWIVGVSATGDFAGNDDCIACNNEGQWLFVTPLAGMVIFDRSVSQFRYYSSGWIECTAIPDPSGGTTIDTEARTAIASILNAMRIAGILPGA